MFDQFCKGNNLLLIEDNAHGAGGEVNGKSLGENGDISFSSPHKILNINSGGVLWLKNPKGILKMDLEPCPITIKQYINQYLLKTSPFFRSWLKRLLFKRPHYEKNTPTMDKVLIDYKIDNSSLNILKNADWSTIREKRQASYKKWKNFAIENGLQPVFSDFDNMANPWCFPAYTQNHDESVKWIKWGWKNRINIFSWPSLPREVCIESNESYNRWQRLICFEIT